MTMPRIDSAVGLLELEHITLKQMESYNFDKDLTVTLDLVDLEPTVTECDNSSSCSHNPLHWNQVMPQTLTANNQPSSKCNSNKALYNIAKNLSDILCKYYLMRSYTTSAKEWKEIAPYYNALKTYYFNAVTRDVTEFVLPQEHNRKFIERFLRLILTLARQMCDNPKLVTSHEIQYLFSEMITFIKKKMTENDSIKSTCNMEKSIQKDPPPPYPVTTPASKAINQPATQMQPAYYESPMPIITHVTSLSPHKTLVGEGRCIICAQVTGQICVGCYKSYYCSNVCQTIDWEKHKYECVLPI